MPSFESLPPARITLTPIIRFFWLLMAFSLVFFCNIYLRLDLFGMYIAIPMLAVGMVIGLGLLLVIGNEGKISRAFVDKYRFLLLLSFWLIGAHIISFLYGIVQGVYGDLIVNGRMVGGEGSPIKTLIKLIMGIASFWAILSYFPRNQKFLERFWRYALYPSVILFVWLIYKYAFVYHHQFLGGDFFDPGSLNAKALRNALAWFAMIMFPYAFCYFYWAKRRLTGAVALVVLTVALMYSGCRMGWLGAFLSVFSIAFFLAKTKLSKGLKMFAVMATLLGILVFSGWRFLGNYAGSSTLDIGRRFHYIFDPNAVPELHSYEYRGGRILDALKAFVHSPILGEGLRNPVYSEFIGGIHNTYVSMLTETGLLGGIPFLAILYCIAKFSFRRSSAAGQINWVSLASRGSLAALLVSGNFMEIYTSAHYWVFLGLYVVAIETEGLALGSLPAFYRRP